MRQPQAPELRLLLACARAHPSTEAEADIRRLLSERVDWTEFVRKSVAHGLAGLVGHTLASVAGDLVPADILNAFRTFIEQTRENNQLLLEELVGMVERLAAAGVKTIPFKGPVLAQQAFGDLGLRGFRDLDLLVHDGDVPQTIGTLYDFGYRREGKLTNTQFALVHWLQGQEILFKKDVGAVEPHTRLTSVKMALDIDYEGLWQRAREEDIFGHKLLTFSPEDTMVVLAIHGGKELWWDIKWACDVADFIACRPDLDWSKIVARAKFQGCYRMLLVATALARNYLGSLGIPAFLAAAENNDRAVPGIIGRILARWEAEDPGGPPSNKTLSMDKLWLHDGLVRQVGYVMRTWFLPGPQHVPLIALPPTVNFLYIPLGLAHDLVALPAYRAMERLVVYGNRLLATSSIALALAPVSGQTRKNLGRLRRAHLKAKQDVSADPSNALSWGALADILAAMKRHKEAIAAYDSAIALMPDQGTFWRKRKKAFAMFRQEENLPDLSDEPASDANTANGWAIRAGYLSYNGRDTEAVEASDRALTLDPGLGAAMRIGIQSRILACDWNRREADKRAVKEALRAGHSVVQPFSLKLLSDSEADCLAATRMWVKGLTDRDTPVWRGERYRHDKIRIAYISTDFRTHPVGTTMIAPLERHDKGRFEITAIALTPSNCHTRQRIKAAADRFIDVVSMGDGAVAAILRELEIDIAVDLNGLTGAKRTGILMRRPAPLQVNYLGYPGTMGAPFVDYIIADPIVIPRENQTYYTEKIAYLPHAYLPYDSGRQIAARTPSRCAEGLPETGFIFASFNRLQKIGPEIFAVWMRLLRAVEDSVLWMPCGDAGAMASLQREALAQGVAPDRLIFAGFVEASEDHLARLRLADLFLDTLPYNAHSTAADALWTGLPVLTCMGKSFQARVAASLLHAVGIPELVTTSLADYEQRALSLVRAPQQLAILRQKLAENRDTTPLFDPAGFTRDLEAIFTAMWERQQAGLAPENFSVAGS